MFISLRKEAGAVFYIATILKMDVMLDSYIGNTEIIDVR
jgi:hypothetical protein